MSAKPKTDASGSTRRLSLNLAIVGGGRACKFFLDRLAEEPLPHMNVSILGVCDIDPTAEGICEARRRGIFTTGNYRDLFELDKLDGILELTNRRDVLVELVNQRPAGVGILEHNIGRFIRNLFLTDRRLKTIEAQLLHEKTISEFLIQQAKQWIVVLNPDFTIADVNKAYLEAKALTREQVIGQRCYEVVHQLKAPCADPLTGFKCPAVETLRTGESVHIIHEEPHPDGSPTYAEIITCPVKNGTGQVVRVIEIWRDISAALEPRWKKRVAEFKSNINHLVQEDRMISLGKLVASCVHEINNPIQGLLTFSHLMAATLAQGTPDASALEELKEMADLMGAELERCGRIVSGLLSFAREAPMTYRETDLSEVLQSVIALTRHKMELQNVTIELELQAAPLLVRGDKNQLQQCFLNLIFNAIEAMPDGGALAIRSRVDDRQRSICIHITDTGCGIPEQNMGQLFDPFFSTKSSGEGTGLGLSIVYGVVTNHGGRVQVHSRPEAGTTFELCFPIEGRDYSGPAADSDHE